MSELHPAGNFEATVVEHGISKSKAGKSQLVVKFRTEHGTLRGWFSMSEKAVEYTIEKALAMGFDGNSLADLDDGRCLVGNKCTISVEHETREGKTNAKVNYVNPLGYEGAAIQHDAAAAKSAAQFDALLRKMRGAAPKETPSKSDRSAVIAALGAREAGSDDDPEAANVPF